MFDESDLFETVPVHIAMYTHFPIRSSVYSHMQNQYSDSGPTPMLFEENDTYWVPASNANELYSQLSSKKYREIIRQQIQYVQSNYTENKLHA